MPASSQRPSTAFTLLEVLIVIVIIGVLAAMMIPNSSPSMGTQLQAVAGVLGRDIAYARNLAVVNNDNYKITFDTVNNQWILTHSGTNASLNALPTNAFHLPTDSPTQQTVALNKLPSVGGAVQLFAVWALSTPPQTVSDLEFLPVGATVRAQPTLIWLSVGSGLSTRYISVLINPITGLYWVQSFQTTTPTPATYAGS
ncbi:MAG: prepilin-type N-terminal cleavage/methylation domain-containing protein [Planctomycetia bacterium]|nr:prepilin-type N-terminal cleavage/methylation domain-containing protein [Planctomycetia bacterium]